MMLIALAAMSIPAAKAPMEVGTQNHTQKNIINECDECKECVQAVCKTYSHALNESMRG